MSSFKSSIDRRERLGSELETTQPQDGWEYSRLAAWTVFGLGVIAGRYLGAFIFIKIVAQSAPVVGITEQQAQILGHVISHAYGLINLGQGSEIALPLQKPVNWPKYYRGTISMKTFKLASLIPMVGTQVLTAISASVGARDLLAPSLGETGATLFGLWALFSTTYLWSYYFKPCLDMVERLVLYTSLRRDADRIDDPCTGLYNLDNEAHMDKVFLKAYHKTDGRKAAAALIAISGVLIAMSYAATVSVGLKSQITEQAKALTAWGTVATASIATLFALYNMKFQKFFYNDSEVGISEVAVIYQPRLFGHLACFAMTAAATVISVLSTSYFASSAIAWPMVALGAALTFFAYLTRAARLYDAFNPDHGADEKHHWTRPLAMLSPWRKNYDQQANGWGRAIALWPFTLPIIIYTMVAPYFILNGGYNNLWNTAAASSVGSTATPMYNATYNGSASAAIDPLQYTTLQVLTVLTWLPFTFTNLFIGGLSLLGLGAAAIQYLSQHCLKPDSLRNPLIPGINAASPRSTGGSSPDSDQAFVV